MVWGNFIEGNSHHDGSLDVDEAAEPVHMDRRRTSRMARVVPKKRSDGRGVLSRQRPLARDVVDLAAANADAAQQRRRAGRSTDADVQRTGREDTGTDRARSHRAIARRHANPNRRRHRSHVVEPAAAGTLARSELSHAWYRTRNTGLLEDRRHRWQALCEARRYAELMAA